MPVHVTLQLVSCVPRRWVQPLLAELCSGLADAELPAALSGLLADSALVRSAALAALQTQPTLEAGECPADDAVTAVLWLARHDPSSGAPSPQRCQVSAAELSRTCV